MNIGLSIRSPLAEHILQTTSLEPERCSLCAGTLHRGKYRIDGETFCPNCFDNNKFAGLVQKTKQS